MYKKIRSVVALGLCLMFICLTACTGNGDLFDYLKSQDAADRSAIVLPQTSRFKKILDKDGKIITEYLTKQNVSVIKQNYDDRVYIQHEGLPYFYNPVYISYNQILNNQLIAENQKAKVLEESFKKAKEAGFQSVALYIYWKDFYNGSTYDFDFYKNYYVFADKYDLNVSIIWIGYSETGYMPWQTDRKKYPSLNLEGTNQNLDVPDLSKKVYINEVCDALTQLCAWINYIDYNHRTVSIQFEDEANKDYGKGIWISQYVSYSKMLEKMANTVKNSTYSMVTTVGINFDDFYTEVEGLTGRERIDQLLEKSNIDGIGAANINTLNFTVDTFDNDNKFCYVSKLSPAVSTFFSTAMSLLQKGYQFGVYELKSFNLVVNCGLYRTHSNNWDLRDRQMVTSGLLAAKKSYEAATPDVIAFIKGINAIGDVLATTSRLDIVILNPNTANKYKVTIPVADTSVYFDNKSNPTFTYNDGGLCVVDPYSNYYVFSFRGSSAFSVKKGTATKISSGKILDGEWVKIPEDNKITKNSFILEAGTVYKFNIK